MAMTMKGEVNLPASQDIIWRALNDPHILRACIPGCESLERLDDDAFQALTKVKIGPMSAAFKGKVRLLDLNPPHSYRLEGEGDGGAAGFAKGGAKVWLAPQEMATVQGTRLTYDVEVAIGGKIAQLGARLMDSVAQKMVDQFFADFAIAIEKQMGVPPGDVEVNAEAVEIEKPGDPNSGWWNRLVAWLQKWWRKQA